MISKPLDRSARPSQHRGPAKQLTKSRSGNRRRDWLYCIQPVRCTPFGALVPKGDRARVVGQPVGSITSATWVKPGTHQAPRSARQRVGRRRQPPQNHQLLGKVCRLFEHIRPGLLLTKIAVCGPMVGRYAPLDGKPKVPIAIPSRPIPK